MQRRRELRPTGSARKRHGLGSKVTRGPHDTQAYRAEIPSLAGATLPQMIRATGLTSGYCWKIRRGERIPHPMYWGALQPPRLG